MNDQIFYTAQREIVLDIIKNQNVYYVKKKFIDEKYKEVSFIFNEAYNFFYEYAKNILPPLKEAESAIWLYKDIKFAAMSSDLVLLKLKIPKENYIPFDMRVWNKILNLEYIGSDEKDEDDFRKELKNLGLNTTIDIFKTSFYPLQKRKIKESWKRLFLNDNTCEKYLQIATWELRKEWLLEVKHFS